MLIFYFSYSFFCTQSFIENNIYFNSINFTKLKTISFYMLARFLI